MRTVSRAWALAIVLILLVAIGAGCTGGQGTSTRSGDDDVGDDTGDDTSDDTGGDDTADDDTGDDDTGPLAWKLVTPTGNVPAALGFVEAVTDEANARMLFYGGLAGTGATFLGEVVTLDYAGTSFGRIAAGGAAPPALYGAAVGWDETARRFYLLGGITASGTNPSLYVLDADAATWALAGDGTGTIGPRQLASAVWDADRLVVFGGFKTHSGDPGGDLMGDLWQVTWNGDPGQAVFTSLPATGPDPRSNAASCLDAANGAWYVYGGAGLASSFGDLWRLDLGDDSWHAVASAGDAPPAAHSARCFADGARDRLVLFGGIDDQTVENADTYLLDLAAAPPRWTMLPAADRTITGRYGGAMAYDAGRDRLLTFGGVVFTAVPDPTFSFFNELWELRF